MNVKESYKVQGQISLNSKDVVFTDPPLFVTWINPIVVDCFVSVCGKSRRIGDDKHSKLNYEFERKNNSINKYARQGFFLNATRDLFSIRFESERTLLGYRRTFETCLGSCTDKISNKMFTARKAATTKTSQNAR